MVFTDEENYEGDSVVCPPGGPCIPDRVLVVFEDRIMDIIRDIFELKTISVIKECAPAPVYGLSVGGVEMGLYQSPIGAPATAIFMERAIKLGARRFLFFGSCGSLVAGLGSGEIVVPTSAYRGDGTSHYYTHGSGYIDMDRSDRVSELLASKGMDHIKGKVWTTDAMFRETRSIIDRRVSEGCIAVEMECSAISALSRMRGVTASSVLFTDDTIEGDEWVTYKDSKVLNDDTVRNIVEIASEL